MRRSAQYLCQNDFEKYPEVNRELWTITPRMMHYAFFLWCGMALLCGGCYKQSYDEVVPNIKAISNRSIVVATHDQRPYIVSGEAKPEVVGIKRGGYGNPFLVSTASGRPLADDMTKVICNGLQRKGFQCIPVSVMASDSLPYTFLSYY